MFATSPHQYMVKKKIIAKSIKFDIKQYYNINACKKKKIIIK